MRVVDKIESLGFTFVIHTSYTKVILSNTSEVVSKMYGGKKINSVYSACIEFIKWFNNNTATLLLILSQKKKTKNTSCLG